MKKHYKKYVFYQSECDEKELIKKDQAAVIVD